MSFLGKNKKLDAYRRVFDALASQPSPDVRVVQDVSTYINAVLFQRAVHQLSAPELAYITQSNPTFYTELMSSGVNSVLNRHVEKLATYSSETSYPFLDEAKLLSATVLDMLVWMGYVSLSSKFKFHFPQSEDRDALIALAERVKTLMPPFLPLRKLGVASRAYQYNQQYFGDKLKMLEIAIFCSVLCAIPFIFPLIATSGLAFFYKKILNEAARAEASLQSELPSLNRTLVEIDMYPELQSLLQLNDPAKIWTHPLVPALLFNVFGNSSSKVSDEELQCILSVFADNPVTVMSLLTNVDSNDVATVLHPPVDWAQHQLPTKPVAAPDSDVWLNSKIE